MLFCLCLFFFFLVFCPFRATPAAYGGSQGRGLIRAVAAGLHQSRSNATSRAASAAYTTAHGNAGSLTHWARPGIEPATSQLLVRFVSAAPQWELLKIFFIGTLSPEEYKVNSKKAGLEQCLANSARLSNKYVLNVFMHRWMKLNPECLRACSFIVCLDYLCGGRSYMPPACGR